MEHHTGLAELDNRKSTFVVTADTGAILGNINRVFLDPKSKKITSVSYRQQFLGHEYLLDMTDIESIGEDVIFVLSKTTSQPLSKLAPANGEDLRNFQGMWVYTQSGKPLAALTDLGFDRKSWEVQTLYLSDGRTMEVGQKDVEFTSENLKVADHILDLPSKKTSSEGLLAHLFGSKGVEEASIVLQRTLRGLKTQSFHDE